MRCAMKIRRKFVFFNPKKAGGQFDPPRCGFFKNVIFRVFEALFFVAFNNIVISHIFPESFIEIPQVVQKI